jgi:hypothetical protein
MHAVKIDAKAVVEAFPGTSLGVMLPDPAALAARCSGPSDVFFRHCAQSGKLQARLAHLLPGRHLSRPLDGGTNHDDRAALVCASAPDVGAGRRRV